MPATSLPAARLAAIANPLGGSAKTGAPGVPPARVLPSLGGAGLAEFSDLLTQQLGGSSTAVTSKTSERAISWARSRLGRQEWNNLCERFVEEAYGARNVFPTAADAGRALATHRGRDAWQNAPVGAPLYFVADATNGYNGHAGIYLGNGRMISATPNGVQEERLDTPYYAERFLGWADPARMRARAPTSGTVASRSATPALPPAASASTASRPTSRLSNPVLPAVTSSLLPSLSGPGRTTVLSSAAPRQAAGLVAQPAAAPQVPFALTTLAPRRAAVGSR